MLTKPGSIIMLISGIVILITSILFTCPVAEISSSLTRKVAMDFGAIVGFVAPIGAGIVGLLSNKR